MSLLAKTLDKSLSAELARVGSDPNARFEAHKATLERFLRSLPLSSNLVLLFKRLDKIVNELDERNKKNEDSARQYIADVHQNSSIHFLKKRETELEQKIHEYKAKRIDLINLAEENKIPKIQEKIIEKKLLGVKEVPNFIKQMDPKLAGNEAYMKDYLVKMKNEVKIKTKIRDELSKTKFDQARVDRLLVSNREGSQKLEKLEAELKLWRVAYATKNYLEAINPNFINTNTDYQSEQIKSENLPEESGTKASQLAPEQVIKMFLHNQQSFETTPICDPKDSQRARDALTHISRFGDLIYNRKYQEAASIALSNSVLHSVNTLTRIAGDGNIDAYRAAIWFATVIFESKSRYNQTFVLKALEICHAAKLTRKVLPQWHSLRIFKHNRIMAEKLHAIGELSFAKEIYWNLEMFTEVADICFKQKQYAHIVHLYRQKLIPHAMILNRFYQEPNFKIGLALFENGAECFGQILLNLLSRGLRLEAVKFIEHFNTNLWEMIQSDCVTDESEWQLIVDLTPDSTYKAKLLVQLAIRDAIHESHESAKSDFDFYS